MCELKLIILIINVAFKSYILTIGDNMGKTHLVHPAFTQRGLRTSKQKKEVRRLLAHEMILGAISLAEEARESFLGTRSPFGPTGEHETLFSRVSRVLLNWQQLAISSPMVSM